MSFLSWDRCVPIGVLLKKVHVLLTASLVRVHRDEGIVRHVLRFRVRVGFTRSVRFRGGSTPPPAVGCVPQSEFPRYRS